MFSPPDYSALENFLRPRPGPWTVPLYLHRQPILEAVIEAAPRLTGLLLDVGCGNKPYASLLKCDQHLGFDVPTSPHDHSCFDYIGDGLALPFPNGQVDSVLCTEVLEHCPAPLALMREIGRVLKPGGHALITVPFFIHHHEEPYDFQRFTRYGMERLASQAELAIVWLKPRGGAYHSFVFALYLALGYTLSRRPFIDVLLWALWPFALLCLMMEGWQKQPSPISLGWQMLVQKKDPGAP